MNPEQDIQDGIYDDISVLLTKADCLEKASAYIAHYLQAKLGEGIIADYDYAIVEHSDLGLTANVEFHFSWNLNNCVGLLVIPKDNAAAAYDRAMAIV